LDYELVEALWTRLPYDSKGQNLGNEYLRLISAGYPLYEQRLLRIADPATHSRILLVVSATDIYGRHGETEVDVIKSAAWVKAEITSWKIGR